MSYPEKLAFSIITLLELSLVQFFCTRKLKFKPGFTWRILIVLFIAAAGVLLNSFVTTLIPSSWQDIAQYRIFIYYFFFLSFASRFIYEGEREYIIYSSTTALLSCVLSSALTNLLISSLANVFIDMGYWIQLLINITGFGVSFIFVYYFFIRRFNHMISNSSFISLVLFVVLLLIPFLMLKFMERIIKINNASYLMMVIVLELLYSLIMAFTYYGLINQREAEAEKNLIKQIWNADKKHYEMQKESVEMINIRIHDLKHQIEDMKTTGALTENMIKQLENSADIYQSVVQTGNDVLDVILSSVSLRCQKNNIQLTAMVDGEAISFMEDTDIYSFFGNMLDNAIEYETKIEEERLRFISLTVKKKEEIVYIHCENYFLEDSEEVPQKSSKADSKNHGYGTKSMKNILEKYKGVLYFHIKDHMFQVDGMINQEKANRL